MTPPQLPEPDPHAVPVATLGYFVVRVRRASTAEAGQISGIVERIGSGEKRQFASSEELGRVVEEWSR